MALDAYTPLKMFLLRHYDVIVINFEMQCDAGWSLHNPILS
jgi:hypothetical protein